MPSTTLNLVLFLILLTPTLRAADPYVGTWKLNSAKSEYKGGPPPREQSASITKVGTDLDHKIAGTAADGSRISARFTIPSTDGPGRVIESATYNGVSVRWFSPSEREITYTKGGDVVNTVRSRISSDEKSMSVHSTSVNARGQRVEGNSIYDKQE